MKKKKYILISRLLYFYLITNLLIILWIKIIIVLYGEWSIVPTFQCCLCLISFYVQPGMLANSKLLRFSNRLES